jgi:hypothetical protein
MGNVVSLFYLTNSGKVTCRLSGYPTLRAITATGKRLSLAPKHGTYFGDMVPVNLRPGTKGVFLLSGDTACFNYPTTTVPPVVYRAVVIDWPNRAGSFTTKTFPPCGYTDGFWESQVGIAPPTPGVFVPVPGSLASLQATLQLPLRAEGGHSLHYTVVLSNPGPRAVSFSPCPGYTEVLTLIKGTSVHVRTWSYELDCQVVKRLGSGKSATFAMEMAVPKVSEMTVAKFSWELDTGNGPDSGRGVTVYP